MKDYFNLRKSKLLLFTLLAAFAGGVSPAWAQKALPYSYGFEDYNLATDGWTKQNPSGKNDSKFAIVGEAKKTGSYGFRFSSYDASGENTQYLISPELIAPNGVIVSFAYKVKNGSYPESFKVGYSTTDTDINSFTWDEGTTSNSTSFTNYENTFPAGTKYVAIYYYSNYCYYLYVDDFSFTAPLSGPALTVTDYDTKQALTSPASYSFGLATAGTTHYFLLNNPGTEDLGVTVSETGNFGATLSTTTVPAGGASNVALTITMPDATGSSTITITPASGSGIDPFVINVSGTIRDASKVYLDFADGQMPDGWTSVQTGSYGSAWSVSTGYISQSGSSSSYAWAFTSPVLKFTEGETVLFETSKYSSSTWYNPSITVEYSTDGSAWTAIGEAFTDDVYGTWTSRSVTIPTAEAKYIRFNGWYVNLRNIYGGQLPEGANFAIDMSSGSFGVAAIGGVAEQTFTVTNSGSAALPITFTDDTDFYVAKTAMFTKPDSWTGDKLYFYAWDGSGSLTGDWPGLEVTEAAQNDMSQWIYTTRLPQGATGIKFSDNANNQTSDISTEGFKDVIGLWYDGNIHTWQNDDFSVPAKGSASFTVRMLTTTSGTKSGNIQLAFDALNAESPFTISVSGVVMPADATVVDFNDNQLPAGWGNNASNKWSFADGKAYCTSAAELTTSKLQFADGDFFVISATSYDDYDNNYIEITGSVDGTTWDAFTTKKFVSRSQIPYGSYVSLVVKDIPTTVKYLKFKGYYVRIDEIAGLKYADEDPILAVTSDSEGNTEIATGTACDLGWVTADATATYYIKNKGTGTLNITEITAPAGIIATTAENVTTVTAGNTLALTVTMAAANNLGVHSGTIVIATDGGNFEIPVSGVVIEDGKLYFDFSADGATFPTGWTTGNWNITGGTAVASGTLQTTTLTAAAGEQMVIEAISTGSFYSTASLSYAYSTDNGENWTSATITDQLSTSAYKIISLGVIDANNDADVLVKFTGSNVSVRRIYGFTAVAVAVMETTAANIAFGMQIAESAEQTFTISNTGEAELTGLSLTLGKTGEDAEYAIRMTNSDDTEFTGSTLAAGATINVIVKQLYDAEKLGDKSDVLTIAADGQTTKTINLTGATRDGSKLYVDFADNSWPEGWQHGSWSVSYGEATSSTDYTSIVTTPLTVTTGDKLSFDVKRSNSSASGRDLIVRYTTDGGVTWTAYDWSNYDWSATETLKDQITGSYNTFEITGIPAGTVAFEFSGKYVKLDNIKAGFALTSAPLVSFATVSDNISDANLKADGTATYTLANKGNADYVGTVAATNVTVDVTGDDVTFESNTLTIPVGKTATITATMAFAAPYGEKSGSLAITSESWVGDINESYTATLVDPTNFVEDFAANTKPAGWYSDGWSYTGGVASVNAGVEKSMITELIGAEEGKNTLTFNAWSTSENQTLNIYTSTDRKNWTQLGETITLTNDETTVYTRTLTNNDQYIKFGAAIAKVDNINGVKKLDAPAHDLYEISTTMAATGTPGASYTATVVGVSLRDNETDIMAELWFKKGEGDGASYNNIATLTNQEMIVNTNKTFTLTGYLPTVEGDDYTAWVTVKKASDGSVYFNTDVIKFTLAHTTLLTISTFENAPAAQADDNNEFNATFNVTVQNTGSKPLAANEISVTLTDNANAGNVFTNTLATTLFLETSNGTVDISKDNDNNDAKLGVWMWNPGAGEWAELTKIRDGFYSVDLKGNTYYKVVRQQAGMDFDFTTCWNETGEISFADGNLRTFNNWGSGKDMILNAGTFSLTNGQTVPVQVTVSGTLTDGEDANFSYKVKENVSNSNYSGVTRSVSVTAAPVIELDETVGAVASQGQNRKVSLKHSFVEGWNTIYLPFAINATDIHADAKALAFTAYNDETKELTFSPVTELDANKPYVIYVPEAIANTTAINFSGKTVTTSDDPETAFNGVTFQGTYAPVTFSEIDGDQYGFTAAGKIAKASASATMKGFRAYFNGIPEGATARFLGDDSQGISTISMDNAAPEGTYNLQGQKVEKLYKGGLYIINGKKQIVK